MSITKSELVSNLRSENPDYYKGWSNEQLFQVAIRERPELLNKLKYETQGQRLYKKIGSAASAGFGKRFMSQFETQKREVGAGLKGMMPWVSTKVAEDARKYAETIYRRKIAEDTELQAYLAWKEDEPGWTNLHTAARSLSEALPSLSIAVVSTGVGLAASAVTGGSSLAITTAALMPMFAMEAGTEYVEAMRTMVDEMDMTAEDARGYAGIAAGSYGVISSLLERVGAKQFLKLVPGLSVKAVEKDLLKSITKSLVKFGADKNFIVKQGARTIAGTAEALAGALREGPTEWMQSVTQQSINLGLKHGLGEDGVGVLTAMQQNFRKAVTSKEALEEGFAGATTGILGFPGGYVTSVSKTTTSEDIAEIQQREQVKEKEGGEVETSTLGHFLSAVISPAEKMGDVLVSAKKGTSPLEVAIQETEKLTDSGDKLLSIINDNPDNVDVIAKHEDSDKLLGQIRTALNKEIEGDKNKIPNNRDDIIREAKNFAIYGDIYMPTEATDVGGLGEDVSKQNPVIIYEPSGIVEPTFEPALEPEPVSPEPGMQGVTLDGATVKGQSPEPPPITEAPVAQKGTRPTPIHSKGDIIQVHDKLDLSKVKDANVKHGLKKGEKYKVIKVTPKMYKVQKVDAEGNITGPVISVYQNTTVGGKWTNKHLTKAVEVEEKAPPAVKEDYSKYTNTQLNKKIKELGIEDSVPKTKTGKISFSKANKAEIVKQIEIAEQPKPVEFDEFKSILSQLESGEPIEGDPGQRMADEEAYARQREPTPEKITAIRTKGGEEISAVTGLQQRMTEKIKSVINKTAKKWLPKEQVKTKIATQFIGEGSKGSSTDNYQKMYAEEGVANTGNYTSNDIIYVSSNGKRGGRVNPVKDGVLQGAFKNIDKAIKAGASIVMDTAAHLKLTGVKDDGTIGYNIGEVALAKYLSENGYERQGNTGVWKPTKQPKPVGDVAVEEPVIDDTDIKTLLENFGVMGKEEEMLENFQDEGSSEERLIKHNKALADKILKRLKKHFSFIDVKTFEGLINVHGINRIGFAMEALVAWSTTDGRLDTMPHEFAHIYVKLLRNEPIIKLGIKQFGSEENLVKYIGQYYTNRITEKSVFNRIRIWLKQFVNRLRLKFGNLDKIAKEDIAQIIAEEFYQGRWLGVEVAVGEQFIEFENENETDKEDTERSDEVVNSKQSSIPNDVHITSFLSKALGIYIDRIEDYPHIIEIAQQAKTFEEYKNNLFDWAEEHVKKPGNEWLGSVKKRTPFTQADYKFMKEYVSREKHSAKDRREYRRLKKLEAKHNRHMMQLHNDWLKALVRIRRFSPNNSKRQGRDTRVYQEWIVNGKGIVIAGETNKITNKKASETNTMNFVEKQFIDSSSENRLFFLPVKEIMYERQNRKTKESFHVQANFDISSTVINTAQRGHAKSYVAIIGSKLVTIREQAKLGAEKIRDSKLSAKKKEEAYAALRQLAKTKLLELANASNLISIIGSKMGDNSAIASTKTANSDLPANMTPSKFVEFIDGEVDSKHMTGKHADIFFEETNAEKLVISKNPLVDTMLVDYINEKMADGENSTLSIIDSIIKYGSQAFKQKAAMSQALARYKFWQEIRVKDYLMHENSAADSMTRLSIDLSEGPNPKGVGKARLMLVDGDVKVKVVVDGKEWDAGKYDDFDGATFTGTRWLTKVAKAYGYKQLHQLKTFIRQKDGDYDYLGMKHMQFNPYKGMRFYKGDTLIAKVEGQGNDTYLIDMNPDSDTYGQKFDMIASPNEAKMTYGKYSKDNDGFYKLHDIDEMSVKVTQVKPKTATAASHPIALGEMLLAIKDSDGNADALIKQIKERYGEIIAHYMEQLNSFYDNPKLLKDFVNRVRDEENIPTELEEYIELIDDETGLGIFHPVIISHLMPILNSRIFKEGIFKARGWEKKASDVYLKPAAHLKIRKNNVMVSSSNTVAVSQVEQAYLEQKGLRQKNWENKHEKIKDLNEWLEAGNDVHVLIHRNPVAKVTGPMLRHIQRLVEGEHGQNMMLSMQDVKDILDGDWDGDKGVFEFISPNHVEAMQNWQNSDAFTEADKIVSLDMYGKRTDKDETLADTSVGSWEDVTAAIVNNAKSDGATGVMVNAKTVSVQLAHKGLKIFPTSMQEDGGYIEVIDPNEEVVMDYIALDEKQLDKRQLEIINNNGDGIVEIDGEKYLKTTKQHELAILFQMAVDAVKYRFWGEIVDNSELSNFEFMLTRVFRRSDNEELTKDQRKLVGLAFTTQNISKRRAGKTKENFAASFQQNVDSSLELARLVYNEDGELKSDKQFSEDFLTMMSETTTKIEDIPVKVEMQNKTTPVEELLMGIGKNINESDFYYVFTNDNAKRTAHVLAMNKLMKTAAGTKLYSDFMSGEKQGEYQQVRDFLGKKDSEGNTFISIWKELLESTDKIKDIRMDLTQDFVNFVDKYINTWNKLSASAQAWATLEMLSGFKDDINILKLPPLKLMDKQIIKRYLPLFETYLREQPADLSTSKEATEVRKDSTLNSYLKMQEKVSKKYENADKKVGVCK